ncbi:MutL mismatch-repair protein pms1 [Cymbomonas tetramitiformis]|uniref:MutL mismatch-repair protein pms1 n=1 Tax=Cymbomonas tetramitiformis TaxID=36881 RepID=A0AAE0FJN5_9CHLO|nr:MutL mismatch-repair protein pms1 [Cymbomonas tetramitiformis]
MEDSHHKSELDSTERNPMGEFESSKLEAMWGREDLPKQALGSPKLRGEDHDWMRQHLFVLAVLCNISGLAYAKKDVSRGFAIWESLILNITTIFIFPLMFTRLRFGTRLSDRALLWALDFIILANSLYAVVLKWTVYASRGVEPALLGTLVTVPFVNVIHAVATADLRQKQSMSFVLSNVNILVCCAAILNYDVRRSFIMTCLILVNNAILPIAVPHLLARKRGHRVEGHQRKCSKQPCSVAETRLKLASGDSECTPEADNEWCQHEPVSKNEVRDVLKPPAVTDLFNPSEEGKQQQPPPAKVLPEPPEAESERSFNPPTKQEQEQQQQRQPSGNFCNTIKLSPAAEAFNPSQKRLGERQEHQPPSVDHPGSELPLAEPGNCNTSKREQQPEAGTCRRSEPPAVADLKLSPAAEAFNPSQRRLGERQEHQPPSVDHPGSELPLAEPGNCNTSKREQQPEAGTCRRSEPPAVADLKLSPAAEAFNLSQRRLGERQEHQPPSLDHPGSELPLAEPGNCNTSKREQQPEAGTCRRSEPPAVADLKLSPAAEAFNPSQRRLGERQEHQPPSVDHPGSELPLAEPGNCNTSKREQQPEAGTCRRSEPPAVADLKLSPAAEAFNPSQRRLGERQEHQPPSVDHPGSELPLAEPGNCNTSKREQQPEAGTCRRSEPPAVADLFNATQQQQRQPSGNFCNTFEVSPAATVFNTPIEVSTTATVFNPTITSSQKGKRHEQQHQQHPPGMLLCPGSSNTVGMSLHGLASSVKPKTGSSSDGKH